MSPEPQHSWGEGLLLTQGLYPALMGWGSYLQRRGPQGSPLYRHIEPVFLWALEVTGNLWETLAIW